MRAWILGILLVVGGLVLAVGLWLLGYHLTGKWAFNHWKAQRVAMGDRLDWKDLVPPAVPVDQNFAEAPLIRGAIKDKGQVDPRFKALAVPQQVSDAMGNWQEGRKDDLGTIARAYGKSDLLSALKPLEGTLKELDEASRRSGCSLPIEYSECETPALLGFRGAIRTLRIRALTNLRAGHPDQALEDLQVSFRIAEHLKAEPNLLAALLRNAILNIAMQVLWEGTEDHLWASSHLKVIQASLSHIDVLASSKLAWQGERLMLPQLMLSTAEDRPLPKFMSDVSRPSVRLNALGRGWFYRNVLVHAQFMSSMVDAQDPAAHRVFPNRLIDPYAWLKDLRFRKDLIMAQIATPALTDQVIRFAKLQALIDEGVVVCALERHRLDQGQYPDRLEALAPTYLQILPHDLVTGGPLHYARQGNTFTLYQVGWDGRGDGGTVGWAGEGKERKLDPAKGDWVWPHAAGVP